MQVRRKKGGGHRRVDPLEAPALPRGGLERAEGGECGRQPTEAKETRGAVPTVPRKHRVSLVGAGSARKGRVLIWIARWGSRRCSRGPNSRNLWRPGEGADPGLRFSSWAEVRGRWPRRSYRGLRLVQLGRWGGGSCGVSSSDDEQDVALNPEFKLTPTFRSCD